MKTGAFASMQITLLAQGLKFGTYLVGTMVTARLLSPAEFGIVGMATSILGVVSVLKDGGLSTAAVQRKDLSDAQSSNLFWVNAVLGLLSCLLVLGAAPLVARFYGDRRLVLICSLLSIPFLVGGLTVQHQALLRRQMRFIELAAVDLGSLLLGTGAGVALAYTHFSYFSVVGIQVGTAVTACVLTWAISGWRPQGFSRQSGTGQLVRFGGKVTAFSLLNYVSRNSDNVIVGRMMGEASLGLYSRAYGLLTLPMAQINAPISAVMLPVLSRLQEQPREFAETYLRALRGLALLTIPIVIFCAFFAEHVVLLMLGPKWIGVAPIFRYLAPAAIVTAVNIAPGWLCIALAQPEKQLRYGIVSAPVCLAAFLFGANWGLPGVALAFSSAFTLLFFWFLQLATNGSPVSILSIFKILGETLVPATLAAGLSCGILRSFDTPSTTELLRTSLGAMTFGAIYVLICTAFRSNRVLLDQIKAKVMRASMPGI